MSVHPAALDLRQGVEGIPQTEKQLFPIQELLGAGLMQARGIFDPVITVQGIKRLIPGMRLRTCRGSAAQRQPANTRPEARAQEMARNWESNLD